MASSSSRSIGRGACSGVFLSFHGPDISKTFLSGISGSLSEKGIHTHHDFSYALRKQESAVSSLFEAVRIMVVILSKNYTSSRRLLNELQEIMEHRRHGELVVLPVFYRVDLTDVPLWSKSLSWARKKFQKDSDKRWMNVLSEVSSLFGYCLNDHRTEDELIGSIVEHVTVLLGRAPLIVPRYQEDELREDIHSPRTSGDSPSQSKEHRSFKVYVSFCCYDVSYKFIHDLIFAMHQISGYEFHVVMTGIEAIEDSQIAIVVFSMGYGSSIQCREEAAKIKECENHGKLVVKMVRYHADPLAVVPMKPSYEAEILEIDTGTVKRWMAYLPKELRFHQRHFDNDRAYVEYARWIVKDIEAVLNSTLSYADLERRSYDVFLSFRGPDCRYTIISHLYHGLCQKGIRTFKDSPELEVGQKRSELFEAIKKSHVAIIMFSENYARSKWCLDELKLIMDLKDLDKLAIIPIFYRVSPEEVRLQKQRSGELGCYQIAMEDMKKNYSKDNFMMVDDWKNALRKAGDLIGFSLPRGKDEADCVEEVIKIVMKLLNRVPLTVGPCQIGIDSRLKEVEPILKVDPHLRNVLMLGIYGPGGVGKTTLSKAICNGIAHKFDDWCFLSEVRDTPLIELQKRLLRNLLTEKNLEIRSVDEGKTMIRCRLRNKRVLVILDDVDKVDQLNALAGGIDWFGKGSRIVISTRNIHVLNLGGVQCRYEVKLLDEAEANDLFKYHASGGRSEYLDINPFLVSQFLAYANGLPLALVVIGRSLCSRSTSEWESILEKLKQEPPQDIVSVLKISFDGLDRDGQEMFLDIACFFNGWNKDYVMKILASCGFQTMIVLKMLVERCLVTIEGGKFHMHDLLEAMGKIISRGKCSKDEETPNRVWLYKDFCDLLPKTMGQERRATKGILLNSVLDDKESISPSTFEDFKRLRLLIVRNVLAMDGSLDFPSELRWFEWPKYAAPAIDFSSSRKIVGIDLRWSEITQILGKDFKELKYLNLFNCKDLEALPNLCKSSHLEELNLTGCERLRGVNNAIGSLDKLIHLNLKDCCSITEVPSLLRSRDFQTINFSGCSKLNKFPAIKEELLFLKELHLEKTAVKELPDSIGNLVAVKILNLSFCKELSVIPRSIFELQALEQLLASGCPKLEVFPRKFRRDLIDDLGFPNLVLLNMQYCSLKEVEFLWDLTCFKTLKEVYLSGNVFTHAPECLSQFKCLEQLWLSYCRNLVKLPEVPATVELHIMGCQNLRSLSSMNTAIPGSERSIGLDLSDCPQLDLRHLNSSLSLKEIRKLKASAEVIVAKKDFPDWMNFHDTDCDANYKVTLPDGILEDDILGLAISVTFRVTRDRAGSKSECNFCPEVRLVVGLHIKFPRSDIDQFDGTHTWFVYIPHQPRSKQDSYCAAQINWSNIRIRFEAQWAMLEICGVRVVCKNEQDDLRFKVKKIETKMEFEVDEYGSGNESGQDEKILSPDFQVDI